MPGETAQHYYPDISGIRELVRSFTDKMPIEDYAALCHLAQRLRHGQDLPEDRSYASGAKCLQKLIDYENERRAHLPPWEPPID
jgi:hypothetical protein